MGVFNIYQSIFYIGGVNPQNLTGDPYAIFTEPIDDDQLTLGENSAAMGYGYTGTIVIDGVTLAVMVSGTSTQLWNFTTTLVTSIPPTAPSATNMDPFPLCFAKGTLIRTPRGEKRVETLAIGDGIRTADGATVQVKWIGRQTVNKFFAGPRMEPVRILAGALGGGQPHTDLTVTADHGMVLDGLVINASALVNGTTIDWVPMGELPDQVTYYHIETEDHDVILANGAPSETYVDVPGRMAFDNYQEYLDLYGAERIVAEMDRPRISSRRLLPDVLKARLGIVEHEIDWDAPLSV